MELKDITTLKEISTKYNIPLNTLKTRITLKSRNLKENKDYKKVGHTIIFSPAGVEKIIK